MLTEGENASRAVYVLERNAAMREEASNALAALESAKQPTNREDFAMLMGQQRIVFGITDMAPAMWATSLEVYFETLGEFSTATLHDAFLRWNRGEDMKDPSMAQFFPRPAQLVTLAKKSKADTYIATYRIKKALENAESKGEVWTAARKAEERQKMIDAGYLNPDGTPNMTGLGPRTMPQDSRPTRSPQEVAEELRRSDAQARHGGAPISRRHTEPAVGDPGDVV